MLEYLLVLLSLLGSAVRDRDVLVAENLLLRYQLAVLTRPPQMTRLPCARPLSRLNGATPTSAAMARWSRWPSSGSRASRVAESTGPTPLALRSRSSCSRQS